MSSIGMHIFSRIMVNYDTPRNIYIFTGHIFLYSFSFIVTQLSSLACENKFCLLQAVDHQSRMGLIFLVLRLIIDTINV